MSIVKVLSEVTGVVCQVLVKPGDGVAQFDPLVLIESMKMEIPAAAPQAGTIATVHVVAGAMVSEGDAIVTIST